MERGFCDEAAAEEEDFSGEGGDVSGDSFLGSEGGIYLDISSQFRIEQLIVDERDNVGIL